MVEQENSVERKMRAKKLFRWKAMGKLRERKARQRTVLGLGFACNVNTREEKQRKRREQATGAES